MHYDRTDSFSDLFRVAYVLDMHTLTGGLQLSDGENVGNADVKYILQQPVNVLRIPLRLQGRDIRSEL